MKKHILKTSFFLLLIACSEGEREIEQIESVYHQYEKAAKEKDIDKMIELTSKETIRHFDQTVENAKYSDSITLSKQTPVDKTLILYLRQTLTTDQLFKYSGKELLRFNLVKSLNTKSEEKIELSKIDVDSKTAHCTIIVNGKASKIQLEFKKEDNLWKYNSIDSFFKSTNDNFYEALKKLKITENEFLKRIVKNMSGKDVDDKLWNYHQKK